jgi:hypothetical protein
MAALSLRSGVRFIRVLNNLDPIPKTPTACTAYSAGPAFVIDADVDYAVNVEAMYANCSLKGHDQREGATFSPAEGRPQTFTACVEDVLSFSALHDQELASGLVSAKESQCFNAKHRLDVNTSPTAPHTIMYYGYLLEKMGHSELSMEKYQTCDDSMLCDAVNAATSVRASAQKLAEEAAKKAALAAAKKAATLAAAKKALAATKKAALAKKASLARKAWRWR